MTFIPGAAMAASPGGRWMLFPARREACVAPYYIRALDGVEARPLLGTELDAQTPPASWSNDSRWVGYGLSREGLLGIDI